MSNTTKIELGNLKDIRKHKLSLRDTETEILTKTENSICHHKQSMRGNKQIVRSSPKWPILGTCAC